MTRERHLPTTAALLFGVVTATGHAHAQPPPEGNGCLKAFEGAQKHRSAGALLSAEEQLVACGQAECPGVVRSKCIEWLDEVRAVVPSISVTVVGADGQDTNAARVFIDGAKVRDVLDGRPIRLDPGAHELRVEHGAEPPHEERLVLSEGQQNREIEISFAPVPTAPPPAAASSEAGISPLVWVGAAVAFSGLVTGGVAGGLAVSKGSELDDACPDKAQCAETNRDLYHDGLTLSHVSTAGFVVAGVGAALGAAGLALTIGASPDVEMSLSPQGLAWRGRF